MSRYDNDVDMTQENENDQTTTQPKQEMSPNQVRKALREARDDMQERRLDFIDPKSNLIEESLDRVDNIFKYVNKPREAVSEANVLYEISVLAKERIKNVHCAFRSFNNAEFMDKLKDYMISIETGRHKREPVTNSDDENDETINETQASTSRKSAGSKRSKKSEYVLTKPIIKKFGDEVMKYFKILPTPKFILGSLEKELTLSKAKIVRQRKEKNKESVEEVRTKIKELSANSNENETTNTVSETERIYEVLIKYSKKVGEIGAVPLYWFMINPDSFSRTIENMFYISFLVKDGYAKIFINEDENDDDYKLPMLMPIDKQTKPTGKSSKDKKSTENIQCMISLTKTEWRELIEVFKIERSAIKEPKKKN